MVDAADLVVVLGREAAVESVAGTPVETWEIDEPSRRGIEGMERMRLVRDDIAARIDALLPRLTTIWPLTRPHPDPCRCGRSGARPSAARATSSADRCISASD